MRMWHKDLIPILPRAQLVAQWRECCLIARQIAVKGTPNHILVNRVCNFKMDHFATYCYLVKWELSHRDYEPSKSAEESLVNYISMPLEQYVPTDMLFRTWHNDRYLYQCISNLEEKFDCGGISFEEWQPIEDYILGVI